METRDEMESKDNDKKPAAPYRFDVGPGAAAVIIFALSMICLNLSTCERMLTLSVRREPPARVVEESEPYVEDCAPAADLGTGG